MKTAQQIHEIDPEKVKVFVHRDRNQEEFARSVEDTRRRGQIEPGEVRDLRDRPREERRRPDGGLYDFGLIVGEGRLLRAKVLGQKFRAFVVERSEVQTVGRFLSENLNRVKLPAMEAAKLIVPLVEAGVSIKEIAERHSMTEGHVRKLIRIRSKTAKGLEEDVAAMSINDAEVLTALPRDHQLIVVQEFKETRPGTIRELVKRAKSIAEDQGGKLSRTALKKSLDRVDEDIRRLRERLKLTRLHHSLGPQNLALLLADRKFRKALDAEGISAAKFERLTKSDA